MIEAAEREHVFAPLPDPAAATSEGGIWRSAFSVPAELLEPADAKLSLDLAAAGRISLTAPVARSENLTSAAMEVTSSAAEVTSSAAEPASAASEVTSAAAEVTSSAAEPASAASEVTSSAAEPASAASEVTSAAAEVPRAGAEAPGGALDRARRERLDIEARLAEALGELGDARMLVEQLEARCRLSERGLAEFREKLVQSWGEANDLRLLLDTREQAHRASKQEAGARRATEGELRGMLGAREQELAASRVEVQAQCERLAAELAVRSELEAGSRGAIEAARANEQRLREEGEAALQNFEAARAQADAARALVDEASRRADEAETEAASARGELSTVQELVRRAEAETADRADQLEQREQELAAVREALATAVATARREADEYERRLALLTQSEAKLRAELAALKGKLEAPRRGGFLRRGAPLASEGRSKTTAELEAKVSELLGRIDQLESELAEAGGHGDAEDAQHQLGALHDALAARRVIEDDLRAMLESDKAQLGSARDEIDALRKRLADVDERPAAPTYERPTPPIDDDPTSSLLDDVLLDRLAKAKALAGTD
ncbi:MAG: hypothetical protein NVSMB25_10680 [Thermoleophilaceae bacterium]